MPNFTLTRDDFEKLGRVKEWDKYKDDNERTMGFFVDGVNLTFDELSKIGHKQACRGMLNENKRRKVREDGKPLTSELKYEYDHRDYVVYYPPEGCVESAIDSFCDNLSELIDRYTEVNDFVDTTDYESIIKLARYTSYTLDQDPVLVKMLFSILSSFRDELVKHKSEDDIGKIPISAQMFSNILFLCDQVFDAYRDNTTKIIQDLRDGKTDAEKKYKRYVKLQNRIVSKIYNMERDRESDHQGKLTQSEAWRLAQAVLNGEMDFAEHLAKNNRILVRISRNYGRKSKALDAELKKVREEFYKRQPKPDGPRPQIYTISIRTFKKYEKRSRKPISTATEAKERKKWYFSEIPPLKKNSPMRFVELLKERLNKKYRKNDENND